MIVSPGWASHHRSFSGKIVARLKELRESKELSQGDIEKLTR
jgi:hypothetical protein